MSTGSGKKILNKEFNPLILEVILARHWKKPFFYLTLFLIFAFFYLRYSTPVYQTKALIQVILENKVSDILGKDIVNVDKGVNLDQEVELIRSDFIIGKSIENLGLYTSFYSEGTILTRNLYRDVQFSITVYSLNDSSLCEKDIDITVARDGKLILNYESNIGKNTIQLSLNKRFKNKEFDIIIKGKNIEEIIELCNESRLYFRFNSKSKLIEDIKNKLTVIAVNPEAQTIEITYENSNAKLSHDITKSLIDSYLIFQKENTVKNAQKTIAFIDYQLDSLSHILEGSKETLAQFQKKEQLPNIEKLGDNLAEELTENSKKVTELEEELSTLNLVQSKITSNPNRIEIYKVIPEMIGKKSFEGTVIRQIEELNDLLEKKEELLKDVTLENESIKRIEVKIQNKIANIRRSMMVIEERIDSDKVIYSRKLGEIEQEYFNLPTKSMELDRLKYIQDLNNKYFSLFTEKKVALELSSAGYSSSTRILTPPIMPTSPIRPNKMLVYALACTFALLIGLGRMLWLYLTYNDIINANDLQKILPPQTNFIGIIPKFKRKMKFSQMVVNESSKSRMAEAVRTIRTNMSFINKDAKVVAISSSISGEGKTFVMLNLAGLVAANGKRTILVDLDLRKPKIHHGFNAENTFGMSNLISGLASLEEVINKSEFHNLDYITAGPIPPNPSELVQGQKVKDVIEKLKSIYDMILIDLPPVGIVSDGVEILAISDIPLYVFKANYSQRIFTQRVEE
ncbi:MAG: polysaccharide biosynthesis tyrosine autokinase, partial [Bacteroidetes bacterium]|nr:polysaccharide biosynthesis tyrosine autokinase [Bacteroidota bacterium]